MGTDSLASGIPSSASGILDPDTELGKKTLASIKRARTLVEVRKHRTGSGS